MASPVHDAFFLHFGSAVRLGDGMAKFGHFFG